MTDTREKSHHEERQQALLDMLNAGGMDYFDRDHLIFRAQKVGFFRILEMLYSRNADYVKILRTYTDDQFRKNQVFSFVQKILCDDSDHDKKSQVEKSVLDDMECLISIDLKKSVQLIFFHMYPYVPLVLAKLEKSPKGVLFECLKNFLELKENGSQPSTPVHRQVGQDPLTSAETYESFIDLMCQLEPKSVSSYLRSKSSFYRSENVLKIVEKHDIKDAQAYLLEQEGKLQEAFKLMKSDLDQQIKHVLENDEQGSDQEALVWSKMNATVILIIQLCQRSSLILDEDERDKMWFELLDCLMKKQHKEFKSMVKHVLTSSLGHISLRSVVDR